MSAFEDLAAPAPRVESAVAESAIASEEVKVEPALPSEDAIVEPAQAVEPAVTSSHKKFAPVISRNEAACLSVTALRSSGSDFEGKAAVIQGRAEKNIMKRLLPIIYDEGDFVSYGEVLRYIFVKANCIFVYGDETDQQPLYLIQLDTVKAIQENSKKPDKYSFTISPRINTNEAKENLVTILLKDVKTGKQVYQVAFDTTDDKSLAKRFLDVMRTNAKHYGGEVISASVVKKKKF